MSSSPIRTSSNVAQFVANRIYALRSRRSQMEIAVKAGFPSPNMLSMIKDGKAKLPLDRVIGLARALECETGELMRLAIEQFYQGQVLDAVLSLSSGASQATDAEIEAKSIAVGVELRSALHDLRFTKQLLSSATSRTLRVEESLKRVRQLSATTRGPD